MTDLTLIQKRKLVSKGKRIDPFKLKYEAEKALGKDFRKQLAGEFDCSEALITQALTIGGFSMRVRIKEFIKQESV